MKKDKLIEMSLSLVTMASLLQELLSLETQPCYTPEHHALYSPGYACSQIPTMLGLEHDGSYRLPAPLVHSMCAACSAVNEEILALCRPVTHGLSTYVPRYPFSASVNE